MEAMEGELLCDADEVMQELSVSHADPVPQASPTGMDEPESPGAPFAQCVAVPVEDVSADEEFEEVHCPWTFQVSGFDSCGVQQHGRLSAFGVQLVPNREGPSPCPVVTRRWEDFTTLRSLLAEKHRGAIVPGLPPHASTTKGLLELFLLRCAQSTVLNTVDPVSESVQVGEAGGRRHRVGVVSLAGVLRDFGVLEGDGAWEARYAQGKKFITNTLNAVQGSNQRLVDVVSRQISNYGREVVPERYQAVYSFVHGLETGLAESRKILEDVLAEYASLNAALDDVGQALSDLAEVEGGRLPVPEQQLPVRKRSPSLTLSLSMSLSGPPPTTEQRDHAHTDTELREDVENVEKFTRSLVAASSPAASGRLTASQRRGVIAVPDTDRETVELISSHLNTLPHIRNVLYHIKSIETLLSGKQRSLDDVKAKRGANDAKQTQQAESLAEEIEQAAATLAVVEAEFRRDWKAYRKAFKVDWKGTLARVLKHRVELHLSCLTTEYSPVLIC